jgi:hypothetical protein
MTLTASLVDATGTTPVRRKTPGDKFQNIVEIQLDNSYPTNGYSMATLASLLGWNNITTFFPVCLGPSLSAAIGDFSYDKANGKVKLYTAAGVELANAADASAMKLYCFVEGY